MESEYKRKLLLRKIELCIWLLKVTYIIMHVVNF